jgi:hypothetical protein
MTSNTNWTSVRKVSSKSSQQTKQKRHVEPIGLRLRRSLPNVSELSETPKSVDQFNCRASIQVDARRQPSVCSDISEMTSNTNWTSAHEVSRFRFCLQQSKQKRNVDPTDLRRSLPNISELYETPKPVDQFN